MTLFYCVLAIWKCCNCTSLHVCYFIFNYFSPPQVAFASLDGNDNGGNVSGGGGSFAPYNHQIHGDGRFAILADAAAKEARMEHDRNNNHTFSFAQNNRLIHWEGKFGRGAMGDDGIDDDEDDEDGGRDVDRNVSSVMDDIVDGILHMLKWINETARTDDFHHANIEKEIQGCQDRVCLQKVCLFRISVGGGQQPMERTPVPSRALPRWMAEEPHPWWMRLALPLLMAMSPQM
jgi:hypothetical protein